MMDDMDFSWDIQAQPRQESPQHWRSTELEQLRSPDGEQSEVENHHVEWLNMAKSSINGDYQ
jgi:hypothetical protein